MLKTNEEVSQTIKDYMNILNISSNAMSSQLDISESSLSRYLNGSRRLPLQIIESIAKVLHVSPEKLILKNAKIDNITNQYTELRYYNIKNNADFNYKKIDIFDSAIGNKILVPNVTLGNYAGVKDICIFQMDTTSLNKLMPNTKTIAVKQVPNSQLLNGDIVVFQNCHGLDVRLYFNDTKAKIISFIPKSTDKKRERFNYTYKNAWHFQIIGKVVLNTVQTKNYLA